MRNNEDEARTLTNLPRTVLVVDDSPQVAANLEIALSAGTEFEVQVAASAVEAMTILRDAGCSIIAVVTDLEMPAMDGFELIAALRHDPRWATIPIIVSSGTADPEAPRRAQSLGANAYFAKPYSPMQLCKKLNSLLEGTKS